jgi:hypothetical protein
VKGLVRACRLILGFTLTLSLFGCGGDEHEIVGKWKLNDYRQDGSMEFFSGGNFVLKVSKGATLTGDWKISEDGRLNLAAETRSGIDVYQMNIVGDKMELNGLSKAADTFLSFTRAE